MKRLRLHYSIYGALLLAVVLLAAQSLLLWHSHDTGHAQDAPCELCVHAQLHTPGPAIRPPQLLACFMLVEIHRPVVSDMPVVHYSFTYASRAPPLFLNS